MQFDISTYFNSDLKFQSKKIILLLKIKNMYMYQIDCHCTPWIFDTTKNWHDGLFTLNWIFSTEQAFITIFVYDREISLYNFFIIINSVEDSTKRHDRGLITLVITYLL